MTARHILCGASGVLRRLLAAVCFSVLATLVPAAHAAPEVDSTPRVAVISAFPAELELLLKRLEQRVTHTVNGVQFHTGVLAGRPAVLFTCGVSMTNAAMNAQLVLDRFRVTHIIVSGIAGGVNPGLNIGDVTVPAQWGQYLESLLAREASPGKFQPPAWLPVLPLASHGMIHPRAVVVRSGRQAAEESKFWFEVDPGMLAAARGLGNLPLERCDTQRNCLSQAPRVVVGGNGVSGPAFVDNAAFRDYTFSTFQANVLDMETAAIGAVAWSNGTPWIALRSLSDLAGGGKGENEIGTFFRIAADNSARVLLAFLDAWK